MLKLIVVIVAVVTLEKASGGGDDGGCSAAIKAATTRAQTFTLSIDAKSANCTEDLQDQFDSHKLANATRNQFYSDVTPLVNGCIGLLETFYNQFYIGLANDIGVSPQQLQQIFAVGSPSLAPPISCVADFVKAASGYRYKVESDFIGVANGFLVQLSI